MSREIDTYEPYVLKDVLRDQLSLLLIDESAITCRNLRDVLVAITSQGREVVIAMPDYQYVPGLRGFAKAQILASLTDRIRAVVPASYTLARHELEQNWGSIGIVGKSSWNQGESLSISAPSESVNQLKIEETEDQFDREMMERAKGLIATSNCWLDPAGVVIVKDREILVEATSTNFNGTHCTDIPMHWKDMNLKPGERPLFCDSLHSERMAISEAARRGKLLAGATMYLNKFPCRPCAQSTIAAGIGTIVFEVGSYGLLETADLFEVSGTKLKRVVTPELM